jgi:hypothetical protein
VKQWRDFPVTITNWSRFWTLLWLTQRVKAVHGWRVALDACSVVLGHLQYRPLTLHVCKKASGNSAGVIRPEPSESATARAHRWLD